MREATRIACVLLVGAVVTGPVQAVAEPGRPWMDPSPTAGPEVPSDPSDPSVPDVGDGQLPSTSQGAATSSTSSDVPTQQQVADYLTARVHEADEMWTRYFKNSDLAEPSVNFAIVTPEAGPVPSKCVDDKGAPAIADAASGPFYCGADVNPETGYTGTIYLPVATMRKIWTGDIIGRRDNRVGDFAAAVVTAHEFGHHVVDELATQWNGQEGPRVEHPTGKWAELIADCMAGVWVHSAFEEGFVKDGDIGEAVSAMEVLGDDVAAPGTHGTPEERKVALLTGLLGIKGERPAGTPQVCIAAYWRTAAG